MELVTVSNNKNNGDRSFSHGIWQILGKNESHTAIYPIDDNFWAGERARVFYMNNKEYDFYDAFPLLSQNDLKKLLPKCKVGIPAKNPNEIKININIGD